MSGCDTRTNSGGHYKDGPYQSFQKALMVDKEKGIILGPSGSSAGILIAESVVKGKIVSSLTKEYIVNNFWPVFYQRCSDLGLVRNDGSLDSDVIIAIKDVGFYVDPAGGIFEITDYALLGSA